MPALGMAPTTRQAGESAGVGEGSGKHWTASPGSRPRTAQRPQTPPSIFNLASQIGGTR